MSEVLGRLQAALLVAAWRALPDVCQELAYASLFVLQLLQAPADAVLLASVQQAEQLGAALSRSGHFSLSLLLQWSRLR